MAPPCPAPTESWALPTPCARQGHVVRTCWVRASPPTPRDRVLTMCLELSSLTASSATPAWCGLNQASEAPPPSYLTCVSGAGVTPHRAGPPASPCAPKGGTGGHSNPSVRPCPGADVSGSPDWDAPREELSLQTPTVPTQGWWFTEGEGGVLWANSRELMIKHAIVFKMVFNATSH